MTLLINKMPVRKNHATFGVSQMTRGYFHTIYNCCITQDFVKIDTTDVFVSFASHIIEIVSQSTRSLERVERRWPKRYKYHAVGPTA